MHKKGRENEFLMHLEDTAKRMAVLVLGASSEAACTLAVRMVDEVSQSWGGNAPYIARGAYLARRDQAIAERFDGSNFIRLARDFGISERHVRNIVAAARAAGQPDVGAPAQRAPQGQSPFGVQVLAVDGVRRVSLAPARRDRELAG